MCDDKPIGDRPANLKIEITMDVIRQGVSAYFDFNPGNEEPEALVFKIADIVRCDVLRQIRLL